MKRLARGFLLSLTVFSGLALALAACGGSPTPLPSTAGPSTEPAVVPSETPAVQASASSLCSNALYPVVQGATYSYNTTSSLGGGAYVKTITSVRSDGFTVTEEFNTSVKVTNEWSCAADGLVSLTPVSGSSASVNTQSMATDVKTTGHTGVTLPTHIAPGSTWTQSLEAKGTSTSTDGSSIDSDTVTDTTFTAVGMEDVTVPAGTFSAMKITVHSDIHLTMSVMGQNNSTDLGVDSTLWYAPGIGEIKSTGTLLGGLNGTSELTSYSIP